MKVQVEIDIFDENEDSCMDEYGDKRCDLLLRLGDNEFCSVFRDYEGMIKIRNDEKCEQCKIVCSNTKDYSKIKETIYRQVSGIYCTCGNKLWIGQVSDENETVALFCTDCEIRISISLAVVNQAKKKG